MKSKSFIIYIFLFMQLVNGSQKLYSNDDPKIKYIISPGIGGIGSGVFSSIHCIVGKKRNDRLIGLSGYYIHAVQHHGGFVGGTDDQIYDKGLLFIYGNQNNSFIANYGFGLSHLKINKGLNPSYRKKKNYTFGLTLNVLVYKRTKSNIGLGTNFFININSLRMLFGGGLNVYLTNI